MKGEFAKAAKAKDRTGAQLMRDCVQDQKQAAEYGAWFREQVQIDLGSAYAGDLISHEEVEAEAAAWRAAIRRKWLIRRSEADPGRDTLLPTV